LLALPGHANPRENIGTRPILPGFLSAAQNARFERLRVSARFEQTLNTARFERSRTTVSLVQ
jgi:hypothetical protein